MSKAILGTKLGMSQVFAENGDLIPVSVIEVLPNVVAAVKTVESDGYNAVQLGYGAVKEKHLTKPVKGQFEKAGIDPVKYLREYRLAEKPSYTVGQTLAADIFAEGEIIDVIGTSRGKGFAGTIEPSSDSIPRCSYVRRRRKSIQRQEDAWSARRRTCDCTASSGSKS